MPTTHRATVAAAPALLDRTRIRVPWRSASGRLWIGQGVLAATYVLAAAPKLSGDGHTLAEFQRLGIGAAGMHTIGVLEVAGAIALLIPRLCGLAALAFVALMGGATGLTLAHTGVASALVPSVFLAAGAVIAWRRRDEILGLAAAAAGAVGARHPRPAALWPRNGR